MIIFHIWEPQHPWEEKNDIKLGRSNHKKRWRYYGFGYDNLELTIINQVEEKRKELYFKIYFRFLLGM